MLETFHQDHICGTSVEETYILGVSEDALESKTVGNLETGRDSVHF